MTGNKHAGPRAFKTKPCSRCRDFLSLDVDAGLDQNLLCHFFRNEHPFSGYFDVHQSTLPSFLTNGRATGFPHRDWQTLNDLITMSLWESTLIVSISFKTPSTTLARSGETTTNITQTCFEKLKVQAWARPKLRC